MQPRIVIVGGGFAGINAAQALAKAPVDVLIIDRKNHHTFQPLLYQVATGTLSPADIAQPIRSMFANCPNVSVIMDEVLDFDLVRQEVKLKNEQPIGYDYLIVASGSTHSYFGHDDWAAHAPGLKTIEDAIEIRRRIFMAFENAEREMHDKGAHRSVNFVIIGGGPTGIELAGAIADTCRLYLKNFFRKIDPKLSRIILIEGLPSILPVYPKELIDDATKQLKDLGVEIMCSTKVTGITSGVVQTEQAGEIEASVILWAAGVKASFLGSRLGLATDRRGCVNVDQFLNPHQSAPDGAVCASLRNIFVIGDLAHFEQNGKPVPGVAQPAIQMGQHVAKVIIADIDKSERPSFSYFDKGDLSTIGRLKAVANVKWPFKAKLSGAYAWFIWAVIHIFFLIGMRNRLAVFTSWMWSFMTRRRCVQLITGDETQPIDRSVEVAPEKRPESTGVK
jgi:NADH dehydrogenase